MGVPDKAWTGTLPQRFSRLGGAEVLLIEFGGDTHLVTVWFVAKVHFVLFQYCISPSIDSVMKLFVMQIRAVPVDIPYTSTS